MIQKSKLYWNWYWNTNQGANASQMLKPMSIQDVHTVVVVDDVDAGSATIDQYNHIYTMELEFVLPIMEQELLKQINSHDASAKWKRHSGYCK